MNNLPLVALILSFTLLPRVHPFMAVRQSRPTVWSQQQLHPSGQRKGHIKIPLVLPATEQPSTDTGITSNHLLDLAQELNEALTECQSDVTRTCHVRVAPLPADDDSQGSGSNYRQVW